MKKGNRHIPVLVFILCPFFSYSQLIISTDRSREEIIINPHTYIFNDSKAGIRDIDKVANAPDSAFTKNNYYQEVNYGFYRPAGWCKFTLTNISGHSDWILKIHQSRVDSVQLYVKKGNGSLLKYPLTGHFQHIRDRSFYSVHFAHFLPLRKNETVTCYLYTQRKYGRHAAVASLLRKSYYRNYETLFTIFISAVCGILLLASLVGIVLCVFVFDKVYIYYSIYCLSFLLLILPDTGFVYAFINYPAYQEVTNNFNMIFYYWLVGWHLFFTIELLSIKTHPQRWMYRLGYGSGFLFCCMSLILLFPVPSLVRWQISLWSYYVVFFVDAYILYAIIIKLFKRETIVYFYLAGFLFTVLVGSILMLADLQVLEGVNQLTDVFFITPVVEILCMVIGLGIHFSNHVKEKLNAQIQLNATQNQIITIQEDERKRIAQDLHDDVGNSLAAVKNMLVQHKEHLTIEKEIDNILQDIRNISHDLMPVDFREYALTDIIRHTVNKFKGHSGIGFEYDQTGAIVKLKPVTELVMYRIVNELITNTIKHSRATHVLVQLLYRQEALVVMVEDDGIGMKKNSLDYEEGIGIKNIRHRAAYIGATLNFESDHKGTLVILEIPYGQTD